LAGQSLLSQLYRRSLGFVVLRREDWLEELIAVERTVHSHDLRAGRSLGPVVAGLFAGGVFEK
jgi:hypothetical protein